MYTVKACTFRTHRSGTSSGGGAYTRSANSGTGGLVVSIDIQTCHSTHRISNGQVIERFLTYVAVAVHRGCFVVLA